MPESKEWLQKPVNKRREQAHRRQNLASYRNRIQSWKSSRLNLADSSSASSPFQNLPSEIQLKILDFLTQKQKIQVELVCKAWLLLLQDNYKAISLQPVGKHYQSALEWLDTIRLGNANLLKNLNVQSNNWSQHFGLTGPKCKSLPVAECYHLRFDYCNRKHYLSLLRYASVLMRIEGSYQAMMRSRPIRVAVLILMKVLLSFSGPCGTWASVYICCLLYPARHEWYIFTVAHMEGIPKL